MKNLIRKILKEEIDEKLVNIMVNSVKSGLVEPPYVKNLGEDYILGSKEIYSVLRQIFNSNKIKVSGYGVEVYDNKGRDIYYEDPKSGDWEEKKYSDDDKEEVIIGPDGWEKWKFDDNHRVIYHESDTGFWVKFEYNEKGREIYREASDGFWVKFEYNKKGDVIYKENSKEGILIDKR